MKRGKKSYSAEAFGRRSGWRVARDLKPVYSERQRGKRWRWREREIRLGRSVMHFSTVPAYRSDPDPSCLSFNTLSRRALINISTPLRQPPGRQMLLLRCSSAHNMACLHVCIKSPGCWGTLACPRPRRHAHTQSHTHTLAQRRLSSD